MWVSQDLSYSTNFSSIEYIYVVLVTHIFFALISIPSSHIFNNNDITNDKYLRHEQQYLSVVVNTQLYAIYDNSILSWKRKLLKKCKPTRGKGLINRTIFLYLYLSF